MKEKTEDREGIFTWKIGARNRDNESVETLQSFGQRKNQAFYFQSAQASTVLFFFLSSSSPSVCLAVPLSRTEEPLSLSPSGHQLQQPPISATILRLYLYRSSPSISDPNKVPGKFGSGSSRCCDVGTSLSDAFSGHHRPPFQTSQRPEESPRPPLHKDINRYSFIHTRKSRHCSSSLHLHAGTMNNVGLAGRALCQAWPWSRTSVWAVSPAQMSLGCQPFGLAAQPGDKVGWAVSPALPARQ